MVFLRNALIVIAIMPISACETLSNSPLLHDAGKMLRSAAQAGGRSPGQYPWLWINKDVNPAELDGSRHLRIGTSGISGTNQQSYPGEWTCEIRYLYAAKSVSKSLPEDELTECATREFVLLQENGAPNGIPPSRTVPSAGELAQQKQKIIEQIAQFGATKSFYIRPSEIRIAPRYGQANSFDLVLVLDSTGFGGSTRGYGFAPVADKGKPKLWSQESYTTIRMPIGLTPTALAAFGGANSTGRVLPSQSILHFETDESQQNYRSDRWTIPKAIPIKNLRFHVEYQDASGARNAFGNMAERMQRK